MTSRVFDSEMEARFFVASDKREETFVVPLPRTWWSRPYEYAWCSQFAGEKEVVLDAACGISHPFKFYLGSRNLREVHACDWDQRILSREEIHADIIRDFGERAGNQLIQQIDWSKLNLSQASITSLPYADNYFDTIFCISVLEHLSERDQISALKQFQRSLNPGGRLVLTFDYPTVNLEQLYEHAHLAGFRFPSSVHVKLPLNAIQSEMWGTLYCYRLLLHNRSDYSE
ncbi:methyltransferase family protein [Paenibacillus cellulosilyticus]|uniref:Methyltransferase family protein n=1 Tax=Paenibacillus cellulosilyticus TaxID=375489 RepID=A0A2V2YRU8_9BACL|nr:class I SAM-dependent methyltransferase [Paenibacillus cellulosilyticus]PWW00734.1 methyltransferase family protein [Paenibacillus cellulosilyticus]QKS45590.1 class I SAM-dependent methyltransferase [Paenibacillus cellulosilyticus]